LIRLGTSPGPSYLVTADDGLDIATKSVTTTLDAYSMGAMSWGEVEVEPEVSDWYRSLNDNEKGRVDFHIDRLEQEGPLLDEPHTKQLDGKLRELRFYLGSRAMRVTYWIAPGRRIILLTVFAKTKRNERRQVERARKALERCMSEDHTTEEDDD